MENRKYKIDRKPISSDYIESKQEFNQVLKGAQSMKNPFWKSTWFYGTIGLATVAMIVAIAVSSPKEDKEQPTAEIKRDSLPEDTECIHPPVKNQEVPFQTIKVDPQIGKTIELASGTKVIIPAGSLNATGNVEVQVRELNSSSATFLAGIPMDYQKNNAFQSAGMIEIRANQAGKKVELSQNLPMEVNLKLTTNPDGFDFWKLNETKQDWEKYPATIKEISKPDISYNQQTVKHETQILKSQLVKVDHQIGVTTAQLASLTEPSRREALLPISGNQRFVIEYDENDFKELSHLKGVEFEVDTKEKYDRNFTKKTWSKVDLSKQNEQYLVTFSNGNKDKVTLPVRPVLKGMNKDKAEQEFTSKFNQYVETKQTLTEKQNQLIAHKKELQENYQKMIQSFQNSSAATGNKNVSFVQAETAVKSIEGYSANFKSTSFGVFNCDRPITYPKALDQEFVCKTKSNQLVRAINYYLFDLDKKVRYDYGLFTNHTLDQLGINKNNHSTLVVIDENGSLSYVSNFGKDQIKNGMVFVEQLKPEAVELKTIQQLLNESTVEI